ncbi:MAG: SDR family NAD(P)-dependent oxidoreductase [Planctomycetota bacterium]
MSDRSRSVLVTGASSGIGRAAALAFAREGFEVAVGARRADRLAELVPELAAAGAPRTFHAALDVTDRGSVQAFVGAMRAALGVPDVLVNNAGLARGVETIADAEGTAWREMVETNVFGVLHVTQALLPAMLERGSGHVVMVGSVAGRLPYAKGSIYCATKRGLEAICRALRLETLGKGIRVTSVDPGLVETEFSLVRFSGDRDRADRVYDDIRPLAGEDVAECILFAATRPPHVNIDDILVMPTCQADPWHIHRGD